MRESTAALQSFLISRVPCFKADLFTFELLSGTVYRWTDFDQPVVVGVGDGLRTFSNKGPLVQRTALGVKNTMEVPSLTVKLSALDTDFVDGVNIKSQIHNGAFAGAIITLERAFMPTPGDTTLGTPVMFAGRMSTAKVSAVGAEITVKGANVLMNQNAPRNVYQATCIHSFCGIGCGLSRAGFTTTNTVGVGSTRSLLKWGTGVGSPGTYTRGQVTMTSGAANGQVRTVKFADATGIILAKPLYNDPLPGDSFSILKGCDYLFDSGSGQSCTDYANTQNWRAFEFTPQAETAV